MRTLENNLIKLSATKSDFGCVHCCIHCKRITCYVGTMGKNVTIFPLTNYYFIIVILTFLNKTHKNTQIKSF